MRYRVLAVVAAAIALSVVAATTAKSSKAAGHTLTVWLQVDAQNGWPEIVAAANNAFENSHPGWNVNVQYQQWTDHLQKFDATIAGNDTPDVIEMGNTEMTKYMAAGAFTNLTPYKGQFDNSKNWLAGMRGLGDLQRQALRRSVLRRLAGDHVPERPVQEGRLQEAAEEPGAVPEPSSSRSGR